MHPSQKGRAVQREKGKLVNPQGALTPFPFPFFILRHWFQVLLVAAPMGMCR